MLMLAVASIAAGKPIQLDTSSFSSFRQKTKQSVSVCVCVLCLGVCRPWRSNLVSLTQTTTEDRQDILNRFQIADKIAWT